MSRFVTDTHALHWHLTQDGKLSGTARKIFKEADIGKNQIFVPSIILIEMIYLVEKGRIEDSFLEKIFELLDIVNGSYAVASIDINTTKMLRQIPRSIVPDMPDRIIAATALQHSLPLITKDRQIQKRKIISTLW